MQKESFLEIAPRCIGVHLQGKVLIRPEMHFNANERVFTGLPRTVFFGSTASLTKEKTRRVGGHMSESLCRCILIQNPLWEYTERVHIYIPDSHMAPHGACGVEQSEVRSSEATTNANTNVIADVMRNAICECECDLQCECDMQCEWAMQCE